MNFENITPDCQSTFKKYGLLRPIYISEGHFLNQFIWSGYYDTKFCAQDDFLFFLVNIKKEKATMMPWCKSKNIISSFYKIKDYFNNELSLPLKMYLVDEPSLHELEKDSSIMQNFTVIEARDTFDYIYEAEKLKTLSGKALHKKKNHLNQFIKAYEGHYKYETLCCCNMDEILQFHQNWLNDKGKVERYESITSEEAGIIRIFENCGTLECKMGGIRIDGKLEAYTIGSYDPDLRCAYIHIEKANTDFNGLYTFINQQFLINEYPDAVFVNREDDLGQENLRKAKLSYKPLRLEKKYHIIQNA